MPGLSPAVLLSMGTSALSSVGSLSLPARALTNTRLNDARTKSKGSRQRLRMGAPLSARASSLGLVTEFDWTDTLDEDTWMFPDETNILST